MTAAQTNVTSLGTLTTLTVDNTTINGDTIYATDLKVGEDAQTAIDFETVNEIHFDVNNVELVNMTANSVSGSIISTGSFGSVVINGADTAVLEVQGNISSSLTGTGSFGRVTLQDSGSALDFIGHITGSSLSTASVGTVNTTNVNATDIYGTLGTAAQTNITSVGALAGGSIAAGFGNVTAATGSLASLTLTESGSALTIQGNLTSSLLSTASIGIIHTPLLGVGNLNPTKPLTVQGDISASGDLIIGNLGVSDGYISGSDGKLEISGSGLGLTVGSWSDGYHGNDDIIPLLPTDFMHVGPSGRIFYSELDGGKVYPQHPDSEAIVQKMIPKGFTATHVTVWGADTSNPMDVYKGEIDTDVTPQVDGGSCVVGSECTLTEPVSGSNGYQYLTIHINIDTATSDNILGGKITITRTV
jgi:hypothetical protein